jgi:hypothetical protein
MLSAVTIMAIMVVDVELGTLATLMATPQMAIYFRKKAGTKDGLYERYSSCFRMSRLAEPWEAKSVLVLFGTKLDWTTIFSLPAWSARPRPKRTSG